jgi:hypothetical protein
MPIRFRCAYCNQLMGIATRKSGTVVRCPRCAGEVIVPALPETQPATAPGRLQLLEADDFGREFADVQPLPEPEPAAHMPLPPPYSHAPLPDAAPRAALPTSDSAQIPRSVSRTGIFLTPSMLVGIGVLLLGTIAVTFLLGFLLGRATLP